MSAGKAEGSLESARRLQYWGNNVCTHLISAVADSLLSSICDIWINAHRPFDRSMTEVEQLAAWLTSKKGFFCQMQLDIAELLCTLISKWPVLYVMTWIAVGTFGHHVIS